MGVSFAGRAGASSAMTAGVTIMSDKSAAQVRAEDVFIVGWRSIAGEGNEARLENQPPHVVCYGAARFTSL